MGWSNIGLLRSFPSFALFGEILTCKHGVTATANFGQHLIRQYTFRDSYDFSGAIFWNQPEKKLLEHVEHCIENIRAVLECNADVAPYLIYRNVSADSRMQLNLEKQAKCSDFEKLRKHGEDFTLKFPIHEH
jgi:hypothetical protein